MKTEPETKLSTIAANTASAVAIPGIAIPKVRAVGAKSSASESADKFLVTLEQMDNERTTLAKNAIEQMNPGRSFDPVVVRPSNKIDTMKNRLFVSRFASLLRKQRTRSSGHRSPNHRVVTQSCWPLCRRMGRVIPLNFNAALPSQ
jgi:hypothetical protein